MSIAVQHNGTKDADEAEKIVSWIENNTQYEAFSFVGSDINFSDFDGVILLGGGDANDAFERLATDYNWQRPLCQNQILDRPEVITEPVVHQGSLVVGIAGCTEEDTSNAVAKFVGEQSFTNLDVFGAVIDDYIERINDLRGDEEDVEDPRGGLDPFNPDDPEEPEVNHPLDVEPSPRLTPGGIADYEISFSGVGKVINSETLEEGDFWPVVTGLVGVSVKTDTDKFKFSGTIEDIEASEDILLVVYDEMYIWDSRNESLDVARSTGVPSTTVNRAGLFDRELWSSDLEDTVQANKNQGGDDGFLDDLLNFLGADTPVEKAGAMFAVALLLYALTKGAT